ncbi:MAG: branched-chain amino acid transport system substrate-binding protein [Methylobacteriaceae bacterium]|jgi:branched-chain amino acid transport system substrate-binding protein|nr:branched-chain amino acid transport system substrate-binding protein [Methylobacteriaceae bacterium]
MKTSSITPGSEESNVPNTQHGADDAKAKPLSRRDILTRTAGGVLAATAFGAIPLRGYAAEPVNIGALYPVTGSLAQIGQGCVNAAKLAVQMVNDAGGIKSLGGAKLNLIVSDIQSDTTVTRTETDRLINGSKVSAIHGCYASALTLIASEVAERAKVPLITGSSSDQLNVNRRYTFTPFARASQFAQAQLQMSRLISQKPKVAVIFENTAFGTSTSNGLREKAPGEGVEIVLFEPYSAGFADASPLINKVKASGADMLFSVSYLNDLILIVRTIKQVGLKIGMNGGSGGFVIPDFYKTVGSLADGLQGVAHWNHDSDENAQKVNAVYQKTYGEFLFEYAGGLVAQTFMLADAFERAASTDPQKVRDALAALDVSQGYAAMCPGGKVKFGPDGKNIYGHPVGVQWQNGDLASVFPKEDARAPLIKT